MLPGIIIIRMTTGAIRLVSGRRPGWDLCIGLMAFHTIHITGMIPRVDRMNMIKTNRAPPVGGMTAITLQAGTKMVTGLTCGYRAVVAS
ncbi:hypothetical protein MNBD_GAMMA13-1818 [hydrothermal vent metagenome]|uniref:Uncharacterized protein n=1 Tax=hydrothermal vent metagenome TaxID=652676 RepID=A0A3B0YQP4_9ZZZZ